MATKNIINSIYFFNDKPNIEEIIKEFFLLSVENNINIEKVILVGGWARAVRDSGCNSSAINTIDLQTFINESEKYGGDVDFVLFMSVIEEKWKLIFDEHLNINIPDDEKNGRVDVVFSYPAVIRHPGIELVV